MQGYVSLGIHLDQMKQHGSSKRANKVELQLEKIKSS